MDLKEKLEQRRKERSAEVTVGDGGKLDKRKAYLRERSAFAKESKEEKQRLVSNALDVITQNSNPTSSSNPTLSREDAENLVEFAAHEAVDWWGSIVILGGIGLGILIGFINSWGLGLLIAVGTFFMGVIMNDVLSKQKKSEMVEAHRLKIALANPPQATEAVSTESEN